MKISESIAHGILSGGSQAPMGSPDHRNWNRVWDRFFKICADHLLAYLARQFPNLNHADAQDVLIVALLKTYRSLKEKFDPSRDKIEAWVFREVRGKALDLLAKKGRISKHEAVALDASVNGEDGLQLHEVIGFEDRGLAAQEETEIEHVRKDQTDQILQTLEALGLRTPQTIEIYRALQSGKKADVVASEFGIKRGKVDNIKHEMKKQLTAINSLLERGVPLEKAIKSTRAKM